MLIDEELGGGQPPSNNLENRMNSVEQPVQDVGNKVVFIDLPQYQDLANRGAC